MIQENNLEYIEVQAYFTIQCFALQYFALTITFNLSHFFVLQWAKLAITIDMLRARTAW